MKYLIFKRKDGDTFSYGEITLCSKCKKPSFLCILLVSFFADTFFFYIKPV